MSVVEQARALETLRAALGDEVYTAQKQALLSNANLSAADREALRELGWIDNQKSQDQDECPLLPKTPLRSVSNFSFSFEMFQIHLF